LLKNQAIYLAITARRAAGVEKTYNSGTSALPRASLSSPPLFERGKNSAPTLILCSGAGIGG
jgi:hypothetical protein